MLVLTRRVGERIHIILPDDRRIVIELVRGGSNVRLAFDCAVDIQIWRDEVYQDRIRDRNKKEKP